MSEAMVVLIISGTWLAIGLLTSLVMGQRGHDPFSWGLVGVLLGPVGAAFALWARMDARAAPAPDKGVTAHQGPVDVLVGLDGSPLSELAAVSVVRLFGGRIGRLTAATVITYDAAQSEPLRRQEEKTADASLARLRAVLAELPIDGRILIGRPCDALLGFANAGGYDVIVVGPRGHRLSERLWGSTTEDLVAQSPVPIMVGPYACQGLGAEEEPASSVQLGALVEVRR
jgi:nucleotide-binding universal stress UspA family protein